MRDAESFATALLRARDTGQPARLPAVPLAPEAAYAAQKAIFIRDHREVAAWKIGLTGEAIRQSLGSESPIAGRLAGASLLRSPGETPAGEGELFAEAELIFEIGRDLPRRAAPYSAADVAAATTGLFAGIELVRSRFDVSDLPLGPLIADNGLAERLVIGDRLADQWDDRFADTAVRLEVARLGAVNGSTAAVMGNPLVAVTWLANWLASEGEGLRSGQFVSSGTCTGVTPVAAGDLVTVEFIGLGTAKVQFTPVGR